MYVYPEVGSTEFNGGFLSDVSIKLQTCNGWGVLLYLRDNSLNKDYFRAFEII